MSSPTLQPVRTRTPLRRQQAPLSAIELIAIDYGLSVPNFDLVLPARRTATLRLLALLALVVLEAAAIPRLRGIGDGVPAVDWSTSGAG